MRANGRDLGYRTVSPQACDAAVAQKALDALDFRDAAGGYALDARLPRADAETPAGLTTRATGIVPPNATGT
jgi:hypothetical protein